MQANKIISETTFTKKQYLDDHVLMVHKGINPYVCDFCAKVFTQAHMMKTHMKNKTCQRKLLKYLQSFFFHFSGIQHEILNKRHCLQVAYQVSNE